MSKFFRPLIVFVSGQVLILVLWLFLPTIRTRAAALLAVPGTEVFWGWSMAVGSVGILVIVLSELAVLWATGMVFLHGD